MNPPCKVVYRPLLVALGSILSSVWNVRRFWGNDSLTDQQWNVWISAWDTVQFLNN
jgi:hypothetical protein